MSKAKAAFISAVIGTVTVIVLLIFIPVHRDSRKAQTPTKIPANEQACSKDPCIEITQDDGQKFQLNDFRFITDAGKKCILFITIPKAEHRETCGNYQLKWIGPDNMDQKHGTPIEI